MPLPEDPESERALLATLSAPGNGHLVAENIPLLEEKDFIVPLHRSIFVAISEALKAGEDDFGALTIKRHIKGNVAFTNIVDVLQAEEHNPARLVEVLIEKRKLRQCLKLAGLIQKAAEEEPSCEVLSRATNAIAAIGKRGIVASDVRAGDVAFEVAHTEEATQAYKPIITTGISWIDRDVLILPGTVTLVAARAKVGKTTLGVQLGCRAAAANRETAFYSLEMPEKMLGAKIASHITGCDWRGIMARGLPAAYIPELSRNVACLNKMAIIEGHANYPWSQIESDIVRRSDKGLEVAIIDYFEYIRPGQNDKSRPDLAWTQLSKDITSLARRKNVAIVLLAQLHRIEDGAIPNMSNLSQTDQLQKDASGVVFLYLDKEGNHWAKIGGSRYGESGRAARVHFDGSSNRIIEMTLDSES